MIDTLRRYLEQEFEVVVTAVTADEDRSDPGRLLGPGDAVFRFVFRGEPRTVFVSGEILRDAPEKLQAWIDDGTLADAIAENDSDILRIGSSGIIASDNGQGK